MDLQTVAIIIQGAGLLYAIVKSNTKTREDIATIKALLTKCPHVEGRDDRDKAPMVHRAADIP